MFIQCLTSVRDEFKSINIIPNFSTDLWHIPICGLSGNRKHEPLYQFSLRTLQLGRDSTTAYNRICGVKVSVLVSFIGGGNRRTRRKSPTCRKSLTNFIT